MPYKKSLFKKGFPTGVSFSWIFLISRKVVIAQSRIVEQAHIRERTKDELNSLTAMDAHERPLFKELH
jgi:hypothetical protein